MSETQAGDLVLIRHAVKSTTTDGGVYVNGVTDSLRPDEFIPDAAWLAPFVALVERVGVGVEDVIDALWESEEIVRTFAGKRGFADVLKRLAAALEVK